MRVIGIIPARYGSSRFPGKPLIDLKGKTMIQRVVEGASKSKRLEEVLVATDDQRIFDHVQGFGGSVFMTSNAHPSGTDRCAEVVRQLADFPDVVINIQGDEPLVDARQLDQLIAAFEDPEVTIATLCSEACSEADLNNPNRIKVVTNINDDALYFSRSAIPFHTKPGEWTFPYKRHIGLYAYRATTLLELTELKATLLEQTESLEQLRWLYHGFSIRVITTTIETPNIDTPDDVEAVLNLIKH